MERIPNINLWHPDTWYPCTFTHIYIHLHQHPLHITSERLYTAGLYKMNLLLGDIRLSIVWSDLLCKKQLSLYHVTIPLSQQLLIMENLESSYDQHQPHSVGRITIVECDAWLPVMQWELIHAFRFPLCHRKCNTEHKLHLEKDNSGSTGPLVRTQYTLCRDIVVVS